jgi:aerobic carbon-monoxide dehydrogenase medium subunit
MLLGLPEFDIFTAETLCDARSLLAKYGQDARVLAGGTDLLVKMKNRGTLPRYLINLKRVPGLEEIQYDEKVGLRIGALTTIEAIKDSPLIAQKFPVLALTASKVGTLQIRNQGTLGGNLANASPAAEFAPSLLTLGASVIAIGAEGERRIPMDQFFLGPGKTVLHSDEVITEVLVPDAPPHTGSVYLKHSLRPMDVAIASAAVTLQLDGTTCRDVKIALGAVGPTPFRTRKAEDALKGYRLNGNGSHGELIEEVAGIATKESLPIDDLRAQINYRRTVVGMLVQQGLEEAITQARSGGA